MKLLVLYNDGVDVWDAKEVRIVRIEISPRVQNRDEAQHSHLLVRLNWSVPSKAPRKFPK